MKVLITGANGLLGSNLVRHLLLDGYDVRAMVRERSNLLSLKDIDVEFFKGNILNSEDIKKALSGCQAVVHAAANTSQYPTSYKYYKSINIDATQLLLEESLKATVERFIYVSSANAFCSETKEQQNDETTPLITQYQSGYIRSKFEAQKKVLDFHRKFNFPAIVVNPTFILGKYDAKPSSGQMLMMAYGRKLMLVPPGGKNFIHVDDVVTGIIGAIEKGVPGCCYLLGHENLSYSEFYQRMRNVSGFPKKILKLPKRIVLTGGQVGSLYEKLAGNPARLNFTNAQLLCADNYYSPVTAISEFQLPQTPIEDAISDALNWFRGNEYLR